MQAVCYKTSTIKVGLYYEPQWWSGQIQSAVALPRRTMSLVSGLCQQHGLKIGNRSFGVNTLNLPSRISTYSQSSKARHNVQAAATWVLEPVGDGASDHLDEKVDMPGPFELQIDSAIVGRTPDAADIVIPVATVSGKHARLEKKGDAVYVTDLDSTNGTYIGGKKLRSGSAVEVGAGSVITFGDEHMAVFRLVEIQEDTVEVQEEAVDA